MSNAKGDANRKSVMILQIAIGAAVGAASGFGWSRIAGSAGCRTGACPLTSNPFISTLYGMVVGGLIATRFH
jgi:hypothetical protein